MSAFRFPPGGDTRPDSVEASLTYLGEMSERPKFHLYDATLDRNVMQTMTMRIDNARAKQRELNLERNGFQLVHHPTTLTDLTDTQDGERRYAAELERALLEVTGAQAVFVTRTVFRRVSPHAAAVGANLTTPAGHVHSDCTARSGTAMFHEVIRATPGTAWPRRRFAIYSLWRALSTPPQDIPIAVCDARSVSPADVVPTDVLTAPGRAGMVFEGMSFRYSPRHEWLYFRDMERDELLVIKAYDSDQSRLWRVPHTAFVDPSAPPGTTPRVSIDVRALAFFAQ